MQSNFSTLYRGHIIPKELDRETAGEPVLEATGAVQHIMNDSGFVRLRRLSTDEIVGTAKAGLLERYFSLLPEDDATVAGRSSFRHGGCASATIACACTPFPTRKTFPARWLPTARYERLSTDRSDCRLSFASPVGLLLSCNRIYNQYVIIDNSEENLQKFEKSARICSRSPAISGATASTASG